MPELPRKVLCSICKYEFSDPDDLPIEKWEICPQCGSKRRTVVLGYRESITLHEKTKLSGTVDGEKKPKFEILQGDDLQKNTGKYMNKRRLIDRENNWYEEVVTDPETGEVIHECKEPLSDHRGHGDAKKKDNE